MVHGRNNQNKMRQLSNGCYKRDLRHGGIDIKIDLYPDLLFDKNNLLLKLIFTKIVLIK